MRIIAHTGEEWFNGEEFELKMDEKTVKSNKNDLTEDLKLT